MIFITISSKKDQVIHVFTFSVLVTCLKYAFLNSNISDTTGNIKR